MNRKLFLTNKAVPKLSAAERKGDPDGITAELINLETIATVRDIKYPRASGIYDACMRQHVIATNHGIQKTDRVHLSRRITFDIGNAVHSLLQNSHTYLGDQRRGVWECRACKRKTIFGKPVRDECPVCHAHPDAYVYSEIDLRLDDKYKITGHPDMFVEPKSTPGVIRVAEFKTIDGDKYLTLSAPLISHVWQIQTYMWMIQENDALLPVEVDPAYGYVIYISKKEKFGTLPIKTFLVRRDREIINKVKKKLTAYHEGVTKDILPPPLDKCKSSKYSDYVAKYCPTLSMCRTM